MSDYFAIPDTGWRPVPMGWRVVQADTGRHTTLAGCFEQADAERIARALRLLEAMELVRADLQSIAMHAQCSELDHGRGRRE